MTVCSHYFSTAGLYCHIQVQVNSKEARRPIYGAESHQRLWSLELLGARLRGGHQVPLAECLLQSRARRCRALAPGRLVALSGLSACLLRALQTRHSPPPTPHHRRHHLHPVVSHFLVRTFHLPSPRCCSLEDLPCKRCGQGQPSMHERTLERCAAVNIKSCHSVWTYSRFCVELHAVALALAQTIP